MFSPLCYHKNFRFPSVFGSKFTWKPNCDKLYTIWPRYIRWATLLILDEFSRLFICVLQHYECSQYAWDSLTCLQDNIPYQPNYQRVQWDSFATPKNIGCALAKGLLPQFLWGQLVPKRRFEQWSLMICILKNILRNSLNRDNGKTGNL